MTSDFLVLGGGPAGAAAAITARLAGLSVVLVEAESFPRHRPGETLHPGVEPLLRQLGAWEQVDAAGFLRHEGIWVSWDGPATFVPYGHDAAGPWRGIQAWRPTFDEILLDRAAALGAIVQQPCRAIRPILSTNGRVNGAVTTSGPVVAQVTIDATGSRHWLARHLAVEAARHSPPLLAWYGYSAGSCPQHDAAPSIVADATGWTWTARVRAGVYAWTRLNWQDPSRRGSRSGLVDIIPQTLSGQRLIGRVRGADVTWRSFGSACAGPGYSLVGDAAAVLDPGTSHGVLRALMTGIAAATEASTRVVANIIKDDVTVRYCNWLGDWVLRDVGELRDRYHIFEKSIA